MINIIVVTHGEFGAYLVEAAEEIVGPQNEGVRTIGISSRLAVEEVRNRLGEAVAELALPDGLVIAVDMPGGTPCNIALRLVKDMDNIRVVSGVNLYMLIAAFNGRKETSAGALAASMMSAAKRSVADIKAMLSMTPAHKCP